MAKNHIDLVSFRVGLHPLEHLVERDEALEGIDVIVSDHPDQDAVIVQDVAAGYTTRLLAGTIRSHPWDVLRDVILGLDPAPLYHTTRIVGYFSPLENDFVLDEEFAALLRAWFGNIARVLLPGRCFYIWGGYANLGNYPPALKESGLYFSQAIVWDKQHPVLTRKDFMGAFELAFYGWREGAGHKFLGPNNATDLWHVKKVNPQSMIHLTEKPVELAVMAFQYSSRPGENVLDLFGGSGSTLIGCEQTGRKAFLMEMDQLYCDVIVQRWEAFTGKKAKRLPAGQTGGAAAAEVLA